MRNTGRDSKANNKILILRTFITKLKVSNYPNIIIDQIMESELKGYYSMVKKQVAGEDRINRD